MQHTIQAAMNEQVGAREFANVAYGGAGVWKSVGVGKSGSFRASLSELFAAIAKEATSNYWSFALIRILHS